MAGLVVFVAVRDDKGVIHSFGPGHDVPAWARKKITNPAVWEGGETVEFPEGNEPVGGEGSGSGGGKVEPPPMSGAGAGRDDWAAYAETQGVSVKEDDKRADIIDALKKAGKRVE